jgi:hypothetical protein
VAWTQIRQRFVRCRVDYAGTPLPTGRLQETCGKNSASYRGTALRPFLPKTLGKLDLFQQAEMGQSPSLHANFATVRLNLSGLWHTISGQ